MFIKRSTLAALAVFVCCEAALGQSPPGQSVNSLVGGAKALQFEINGDFDLSSFQGSIISYKIQTSPGSATRIGLSLSGSSNNIEGNSLRDDGAFSDTDQDISNWSIGITAQRIFYSQPSRRISFFWGLGPTASYSNLDSESMNRSSSSGGQPPIRESLSGRDRKTWAGGVSSVAGVELFLSKSISLLAEYGATVKYSWSKTTNDRRNLTDGVLTFSDESETVSKGWSLGAQAVKFGVSAYFGI